MSFVGDRGPLGAAGGAGSAAVARAAQAEGVLEASDARLATGTPQRELCETRGYAR